MEEVRLVHIPRTGGTSVRTAFGWELGKDIHWRADSIRRAVPGVRLFTIVRNPWARAVSIFQFFNRTGSFGDRLGRPFRDWVAAGMPHPSGRPPILYFGTWHAIDVRAPQKHFVDDDVRVFRFENLDWVGLCRFVEGGRRPRRRRRPHVNRSPERPSLRRIYDRATLRLIADRYREDIDWLGYKAPKLAGSSVGRSS